jgi:hypothetical protein
MKGEIEELGRDGVTGAGNFSRLCDVFVTRVKSTTPLFLSNVTEVAAMLECCCDDGRQCDARVGSVAMHMESLHAVGPRVHAEQTASLAQAQAPFSGLPDIVGPLSVALYQPLRPTKLDKDECAKNEHSNEKTSTNGRGSHALVRIPFRLLNFNIWNYNGDWGKRLQRIQRMMASLQRSRDRFLAAFSSPSGVFSGVASRPPSDLPHVVVFQEVRYHNHFQPASAAGLASKLQSSHLWRHWARHYNTLHLAAMTYLRLERGVQIEAEGPMIMQLLQSEGRSTSSPPIEEKKERGPFGSSSSDPTTTVELVAMVPLRLTRLGRDGDDHQRLLLCAVFIVKASRASDEWDESRSLRVDVCTSHFSLAGDAQLLNAMEVVNLTKSLARRRFFSYDALAGPTVQTRAADVTIFAGDLNALPDAACITHLQSPGKGGGFRDAFHTVDADSDGGGRAERCRIHDPQRESDFALCNGYASEGEADGLTFDSNAESLRKRIDFVLYKAWGWERRSSEGSELGWWDVVVNSLCRLGCRSGREPAAASDHLALLADFEFVRRNT